jgi:hypothetical protein
MKPVDKVAMVLAIGLSLTIVLILVVSAIQVLEGKFPQIMLSENATQIMIAATGGVTGLLGAYIGVNRKGE